MKIPYPILLAGALAAIPCTSPAATAMALSTAITIDTRDADNDGLPCSWEETFGMSDGFPNDAGLDADGDGFDNGREYLAGTDPNNAHSFLRPGELLVGSGPAVLNRLNWASAAGCTYRIERSVDLVTWETVADDVAGTPPQNILEESFAMQPGQPIFYRVIAK